MARETCSVPRWTSTPKQIAAERRAYSRHYPAGEYREVPISMIDRESLLPFRLRRYAGPGMDPKGGPKYVRKLSNLMRSCTPLPPAHGYVCTTGVSKRKAICLLDGHHRTNAALQAGVGTVPVIVWSQQLLLFEGASSFPSDRARLIAEEINMAKKRKRKGLGKAGCRKVVFKKKNGKKLPKSKWKTVYFCN
jgi:hypothetical protein